MNKKVVGSIATIGIATILGTGYLGANNNQTKPAVKHIISKKERSDKEFNDFKANIISALQKDDYNEISKYIDKVSKNLKNNSDYIAFKEDLDVIIRANKIINEKKVDSYQSIIESLKLHESSDSMLKREAEDLSEKVVALKTEKDKKVADAKKAEEEASATKKSNPVDMTNIRPVPASLANYTPMGGTIYDEDLRGDLIPILTAKEQSGQDDPHNLLRRLAENENQTIAYLDHASYMALQDIGIRAYASYVGTDFLDNVWIAKYLHDAGYCDYFIGQQQEDTPHYDPNTGITTYPDGTTTTESNNTSSSTPTVEGRGGAVPPSE